MQRGLAAACAFTCGVAFAQERGRLLSVRAGGDAAESSIELVGDRPLSFTTLKLHSPPRVVVDLAETDLALPVRDLAVDDGTIRRVAAAPAGQKTARVVIELAADAEFAVRAQGSTIEVRVPRVAPLLAQAEPPGEPADRPLPPAQVETGAGRPETPPSTAPTSPGDAVASTARPPSLAAGEPGPAAPGGGKAVRKQRQKEEHVAAYADAQRLAAETAAASQKAARGPRMAAADKTAVAPRHSITGIGFRPVGDGQVIVRSDHPLEVSVSAEGNAVVLHLASAGIPLPNNRRPLDTHFFNGPVQRVVPLAVASGTDLRIELREHAEFQLAQAVGILTVTFSVPR